MKNIQLHSEFRYLLREQVLKELSQYIGSRYYTIEMKRVAIPLKFKLHRRFPEVPIFYVIHIIKRMRKSYTVSYDNGFWVDNGKEIESIVTKFQNASEQFEKRLQVAKMIYAKIDNPVFVISTGLKLEIYAEILAGVKKEFGIN